MYTKYYRETLLILPCPVFRCELDLKGFRRDEIAMTIVAPFFMSTDMFRGVRTKIPLVSPDDVAARIVHAIRLNQEFVVAPWWSSWCYVVKQILPYKVNR